MADPLSSAMRTPSPSGTSSAGSSSVPPPPTFDTFTPPPAMKPPSFPEDRRQERAPASFAPVSDSAAPFQGWDTPSAPKKAPPPPDSFSQSPSPTPPPLQNKSAASFAPPPPLSSSQSPSPPSGPVPPQSPAPQQEFLKKINDVAKKMDTVKIPPVLFRPSAYISLMAGIFIIGLIFGSIVFGGKNVPTAEAGSIGGIVHNPDARGGTQRCGLAPRGQACVVYIMNTDHVDREGKTFFQAAAEMVGAQKYVVDAGNPNYANTIIRPGRIGQFYIMQMK